MHTMWRRCEFPFSCLPHLVSYLICIPEHFCQHVKVLDRQKLCKMHTVMLVHHPNLAFDEDMPTSTM